MSIISGSQSYCVGLWQTHRFKEPILQGAHAIWSLGAAIGPLIIKPFLVELSDLSKTIVTANLTDSYTTSDFSSSSDSMLMTTIISSIATRSPEEMKQISMAQYAYLAIGLIMGLSSVLFGILYFYRRSPLIVRVVPPVKTNTP